MRTPEERKEWERLCRQYNVDSLYEAIEGCREELEFLVHCAERLEPLPDDDTPALRPATQRLQTTPFNTYSLRRFCVHETPFYEDRKRRFSFRIRRRRTIFNKA